MAPLSSPSDAEHAGEIGRDVEAAVKRRVEYQQERPRVAARDALDRAAERLRTGPISQVVAVIPAKYASTRLPGKVLHRVGDRTLLDQAIDSALASYVVDRTYVISEHEKVLAAARERGVVAIEEEERPPGLPLAAVHAVSDVIERVVPMIYRDTTAVIMLLPTAPRRTSWHVDAAYANWRDLRDRVTSVNLVSATYEPVPHGTIVGSRFDYTPRARSNGAIQIGMAEDIWVEKRFLRDPVILFPMEPWRSLDVDTLEDLEAAREDLHVWNVLDPDSCP